MLLITQGGEELLFMLVAIFFYICIDKKFGLRLIYGYLLGAVINESLKLIFRAPRPYENGDAVSIGDPTPGYSFPSGHSNAAALLATPVCMRYGLRKRWWVYLIGAAFVLLIMFSRVYLGQHYIIDVVCGAALGIILAVGFKFLFELMEDREHIWPALIIPILLILCFVLNGHRDLFVAAGAYSGIALGYFLEKKFVACPVKAKWWVQILKLVLTFGVLLAIKEGLKPLFNLIVGQFSASSQPAVQNWFDFVRYFLMTVWAGVGALAVTKFFYKVLKYSPDPNSTLKTPNSTLE